jgi:hypothetical protein
VTAAERQAARDEVGGSDRDSSFEAALKRTDGGAYGTWVECGKAIAARGILKKTLIGPLSDFAEALALFYM